MYEILVPVLIGFTILVGSLLLMIHASRNSPKEHVHNRIKRYSGESDTEFDIEKPSRKLTESQNGSTSSTRLKLLKAGWRARWAPAALWVARGVMALLGVLSIFLFSLSYPGLFSTRALQLAQLLFAGLGFLIPTFIVDYRIKSRRQAITWELPEVLDLLVVCVEAGMGLEQGIARVTQEMSLSCPVLHSEFKQMSLELLAGKGRSEALKRLAARIDVPDLDSLVTMLIQANTLGTSISQTLRVFADSLRSKRFLRAEEMAGKLPVKLLIPLILFIFPMLLIIILGPAIIRIAEMFQK
ncbi:type II secretion system F family protein [Halodesulfovibrio aestuarii]|uniref:Type II secretion system F family protein n=1 Tax=Halodesulfovibrio aestuarii TaxID=126333 RepID=A0ABV4JPZ0_9BACT